MWDKRSRDQVVLPQSFFGLCLSLLAQSFAQITLALDSFYCFLHAFTCDQLNSTQNDTHMRTNVNSGGKRTVYTGVSASIIQSLFGKGDLIYLVNDLYHGCYYSYWTHCFLQPFPSLLLPDTFSCATSPLLCSVQYCRPFVSLPHTHRYKYLLTDLLSGYYV